jgi:hypothetical protein
MTEEQLQKGLDLMRQHASLKRILNISSATALIAECVDNPEYKPPGDLLNEIASKLSHDVVTRVRRIEDEFANL